MLIFLNKQRENVENAGRVNKRRVHDETILPVARRLVRLIYRKTLFLAARFCARKSSWAYRRSINLSGRCL